METGLELLREAGPVALAIAALGPLLDLICSAERKRSLIYMPVDALRARAAQGGVSAFPAMLLQEHWFTPWRAGGAIDSLRGLWLFATVLHGVGVALAALYINLQTATIIPWPARTLSGVGVAIFASVTWLFAADIFLLRQVQDAEVRIRTAPSIGNAFWLLVQVALFTVLLTLWSHIAVVALFQHLTYLFHVRWALDFFYVPGVPRYMLLVFLPVALGRFGVALPLVMLGVGLSRYGLIRLRQLGVQATIALLWVDASQWPQDKWREYKPFTRLAMLAGLLGALGSSLHTLLSL